MDTREHAPAPAQHATGAEWGTEWQVALDELEITVARAEELLRHPDAEQLPEFPHWAPRNLGGPPPPDQMARARALLDRQQRVIADTAAALSSTRQQLGLAKKVQATAGHAQVPVYLDLAL